MLKSVYALVTVALFSFTLTMPLFAEEPNPPTPGPADPAAGDTLPNGAKVTDTKTTTVEPTSGPNATDNAAVAATDGVAPGAAGQAAASGAFNYSFRLRLGASAWFGQHFESVYKSSTSDLRGQANPNRIDWVNSLDAKLDSITVVPELELCFGIINNLRFSYYKYNFEGSSTTKQVFDYGDVHYPTGTKWKGKGNLSQFDVLYELAFVKQPPQMSGALTFEWRLGIGVKVVTYDFEIEATAPAGMFRYGATVPQNVAITSVSSKDSQTIPIPIASTYLEAQLGVAPFKFGYFLDVQWISTPKLNISGDKLLAQLTDIKTGLTWYPHRFVRAQVGMRYWRAKVGFEETGGQGRQVDGFSTIAGVYAGLVFEY